MSKNRQIITALTLAFTLLAAEILPAYAAVKDADRQYTESILAEEKEEGAASDAEDTADEELLGAEPYSGVIDTANWMSKIADKAYLSQLNLPGTRYSMASNTGKNMETQNMRISEQLEAGVRVLDIHLGYSADSGNKLVGMISRFPCIWPNSKYNTPYSIAVALEEAQSFLREHPRETVVMFVKEEAGGNTVKKRIRDTIDLQKEFYPKLIRIMKDGDEVPVLGEVRGQLLIFNDDETAFVPNVADAADSDGWKEKEKELTAYFSGLSRQRIFERQELIQDAVEEEWPQTAVRFSTAAYRNQTDYDVSSKMTAKEYAVKQINPWLIDTLNSGKYDYKRFGWFLCDFMTKDLAKAIIRTNNFGQKAKDDWFTLSNGVLAIYDDPAAEYTTLTVPWAKERESIKKIVFEKACRPKGTIAGWFADCTALEEVKGLSNLDLENITDCTGLFKGCKSLQIIDGMPAHTEKIRQADCLYEGCSELVDGTNLIWEMPQVKSISLMFKGCSKIRELDLSKFGSELTQMKAVFYGCESLERLNGAEKLNVHRVQTMESLFENCKALNELSVKNWDVSFCENMKRMFAGSGIIGDETQKLDLSSWSLEICYDFTEMFLNCGNLKGIYLGQWCICEESCQFAERMKGMFDGCSQLSSIYVSQGFNYANRGLFDRTDVQMFNGCISLAGGNGTRYQKGQAGNGYFRVDGEDGEKGYLTAVAAQSGVTVKDAVYSYDGSYHSISVTQTAQDRYTCSYRDENGRVTSTIPSYRKPGTYSTEVLVRKDGNLLEKYTAKLTIKRKDLTDEDVKIYFLNDRSERLTEPLQVIPSKGIWLGFVMEKIHIGDTWLEKKYDYKITGDRQAAPGRYVLTITGINNYTGVIRKEWSYLKTLEDVELHCYTGVYDEQEHSASVSLVQGGVFTGLTTKISYSEDGTNWQTEPLCYKNAGTYEVYYKVEGYSSLLGSGQKKASPDSVVRTEDQTGTENDQESLLENISERLLGSEVQKPVQTAEGVLSVVIRPLELTVTAADIKALPGCEFVYPEYTLSGSEAAKRAKIRVTIGDQVLGEDRKLRLDKAGIYEVTAELEPTPETEELCANILFTFNGASVTVLDVTSQPGDVYVFRKEELRLMIGGADVQDKNLRFLWQEKEKDSDTWKNVKYWNRESSRLYGTVDSERNGSQFRCLVTLTGQAPEMTLETEPVQLQVIDALCEADVKITGTTVEYDGTEHKLTVEGIGVAEDAAVTFCEEEYGEYTAEEITRKDAGSTTIYYCVEKDGYLPYYGTAVLTVTKKSISSKEMHVEIKDGVIRDSIGYWACYKEYTYDGNLHPKTEGADRELITVIPSDAGEVTVQYGDTDREFMMEQFPAFRNVRYDEGKVVSRSVYYRITSTNYQDRIGELRVKILPKDLRKTGLQLLPANSFIYDGKEHAVYPYFNGIPINMVKGIRLDEDTPGATVLEATKAGTYQVTVQGSGNYKGRVTASWKILTAVPEVTGENVTARYDAAHPEKTYHAEVKVNKPADALVRYGRYTYDASGELELKWQNEPFCYSAPGTYVDLFLVVDPAKNYEDYVGITTVVIGDVTAEDETVTYDGEPHSITVYSDGMFGDDFWYEEDGEDEEDWQYNGMEVLYSLDGVNYRPENYAFTDAGTYQVYYQVTFDAAEKAFTGSAKLVIEPAQINAEDISLMPQDTFGYDGRPHTVSILVKGKKPDGRETVLSGDALTQTQTGIYHVTVTGKGNYCGSVQIEWRIKETKVPELTLKNFYGYHDEAAHTARVVLPDELLDAEVFYYANRADCLADTNASRVPFSYTDAGTHTFWYRVSSKEHGSFTGALTVSIASFDVVSWKGFYDGASHSLKVRLSDELKENTQIFYSDSENGEYSRKNITVTDANGETDPKTVYVKVVSSVYGEAEESGTITVLPVSFTEEEVMLSPQTVYGYDGSFHEVKVLINGREAGSDFRLTGTLKAAAAGNYSVQVEGTGNYTGKITKTWKIVSGTLPEVVVENYAGVYDGKSHNATLKLPAGLEDAEVSYIHYGWNVLTGAYERTVSKIPFAYEHSGFYSDLYEVKKNGYETLTGVMQVNIYKGELTVVTEDAWKLTGQEDPEYYYYIEEEGYEDLDLPGILFERESGEVRGNYIITARQKAGSSCDYLLHFESGLLHILSVDPKKTPADRSAVAGEDVSFSVSGEAEDLAECIFIWEILIPGSTEWEIAEDQDYSENLKLEKITKEMNGTKVRCEVLVGDSPDSDCVSREAVLSVYGTEEEKRAAERTAIPEDEDSVTTEKEYFIQNADGSWSLIKNGQKVRNAWEYAEYSYVENGFVRTVRDWFRFDKDGRMLTGWYTEENGDRYYLNEQKDGRLGRMMVGLAKDTSGRYYYFNPKSDGTQGRMLTGWQKAGAYWYYFIEDKKSRTYGSMLISGKTPDGRRVDGTGRYLGTDEPGK